ncbi:MAG TPA: hypothetical protein VFV32_11260 [Acidimicrobiales bacterium]|nr:hypothetical protein [Acidimicrobiales bacterium]
MPAAAHPTIPEDTSEASRHRRIAYTVSTVVLTALLGLVVLDGLSVVDAFGVDTSEVSASGGGYTLTVTAATVSRPGLATPLKVRLQRDGGFDDPIELAFDRSYLQRFDFNRMYPEASGDHSRGDLVVLEFDPPDGDELVVELDGRLEPAVQSGFGGTIGVLEGDEQPVEVSFHTRVMP